MMIHFYCVEKTGGGMRHPLPANRPKMGGKVVACAMPFLALYAQYHRRFADHNRFAVEGTNGGSFACIAATDENGMGIV